MEKEIEARINKTMKAKARDLAEEEGRGYIEAEWLQNYTIKLPSNIIEFLDDAESKGYTPDDITVGPFIMSTKYGWYSYSVSHRLLGQRFAATRKFPDRNTHRKDFVMPLLQKEDAEQDKRKKEKLENELKEARATINRLRDRIDELTREEEEDENGETNAAD